MKSALTGADIAFYQANGYLIFRQAVPANLITDLRRTAAKAIEVARRLHGPQAQRLAELNQLDAGDVTAVRAFSELPELNVAIQALLTPRHRISGVQDTSLLFEPAEGCWAMEWHRDWRDHMSAENFGKVFAEGWETLAADPRLFNQINCALYEDPCTWFVPGSHRRLQDTPGEIRAVKAADSAALANKRRERTEAEQEILLDDYCRGMPGAVPLRLQAGDLAIYRSIAWHTGSYVPYRKRATLHCSATTPEYEQFWKRAKTILANGGG